MKSATITDVKPLHGFELLLTFDNNEKRVVDLSDRVQRLSGVFEKVKKESYFQSVMVSSELGTIVWQNGADFCPDVLYESSRPV